MFILFFVHFRMIRLPERRSNAKIAEKSAKNGKIEPFPIIFRPWRLLQLSGAFQHQFDKNKWCRILYFFCVNVVDSVRNIEKYLGRRKKSRRSENVGPPAVPGRLACCFPLSSGGSTSYPQYGAKRKKKSANLWICFGFLSTKCRLWTWSMEGSLGEEEASFLAYYRTIVSWNLLHLVQNVLLILNI